MNETIVAAIIGGIFAIAAAVITGVFTILSVRDKRQTREIAVRGTEATTETTNGTKKTHSAPAALLQDLAQPMPIGVTRPSEFALGSIMCSVGGVLVGIGLLVGFTSWASGNLVLFIVNAVYCLGIGIFLIRGGYRNHLLHISIGRENGDIIQTLQRRLNQEDGFLEYLHTDEKIREERKKWERR